MRCDGFVQELSSGEGDYRESVSFDRLPKLLIFFRCVQFALDGFGVDFELKTPSAYNIHPATRAGLITSICSHFRSILVCGFLWGWVVGVWIR